MALAAVAGLRNVEADLGTELTQGLVEAQLQGRAHGRAHLGLPLVPRATSARAQVAAISRAAAHGALVERLAGGQSATTDKVTLDDGRVAVHKTGRLGFDPQDNRFLADGEALASRLADAIGAPIAAVYQDGPESVWVQWTGDDRDGVDKLLDSPEGLRIGLLDAITGYQDRESGLRVLKGKLVGFDSGGSWLQAELGNPVTLAGEAGAPSILWTSGPAPLDLVELGEVRERMATLRPVFKDAGREKWLDWSLEALGRIEQRADAPPAITEAVDEIEKTADDRLGHARALALDEPQLAVTAADVAEQRAEASVGDAVHEQVMSGIRKVADEADDEVRLVWIAERDACVHCLAYAGHISGEDGKGFPWGLTFSDPPKPLKQWKPVLDGPPLHPHCRCVLMAWNGFDGGGPGENFPDSLKREARRSIVKGFALPSESVTARQRAASALLAVGARLPKTVEAKARSAIRSGKFRTKPAP